MNIYWSVVDSSPDMSLTFLPPERLIDNIPEHLKYSEYHKCPAFISKIKNTYVLRSPFDLEFKIDKNGVFCNNELFNKVNLNDLGHKLIQIQMPYIFFADKSCEATLIHPYLHHNTFTDNANTIYGEYDIGRWFRPIQSAFILNNKDSHDFDIKRGDVFAYIKFEKSAKLKHFHMTSDIQNIMEKCLNVKKSKLGVIPLDKCYDLMLYYRYNKILRDLIEQEA